MKLWILLLAALILLSGCTAERTPSQIYEEYNARVIGGIIFDDEKAYYTKRKQDEVESKFPHYMKKMEKSREEVIEFYSKFSQEHAKCKELSLVREAINKSIAELEYSQKDICGNKATTPEKQLVRMINEDGWKIDEIEISL